MLKNAIMYGKAHNGKNMWCKKKKCFWGFCQVLCTQTHPAAWNCSFCNIMWSTEKHIVPVLCTYLAREQFVKQLGNCVSKIAHRIKQQWASSQQIRCINCSNQCKDSQSLRLLVKDAGYKTARWAGRTKPSTQRTRRDHFFFAVWPPGKRRASRLH